MSLSLFCYRKRDLGLVGIVCLVKRTNLELAILDDLLPFINVLYFCHMEPRATPKQVVEKWLNAFNNADTETLQALYAKTAINHQMPNAPIVGQEAIGKMFRNEFAIAPDMHCIPVQIIEEGNWAVLEWTDPKGFRGCGFFEVNDGLIQTQRGYWDRLTFNMLYKIGT